MKILIASDIHGSADWCAKLVKAFADEGAERLVLLGDILYHGPRNPLPDGYAPQEVVKLLTPLADRIVCVRGNCDSEVDQMVLPFNVSSDYADLVDGGIVMHLSHGHRAVPPMAEGQVYLTGHTHVPLNAVENGVYHLNPGSVALPKEGSAHSYIVCDGRTFLFKDFDGNIFDRREI